MVLGVVSVKAIYSVRTVGKDDTMTAHETECDGATFGRVSAPAGASPECLSTPESVSVCGSG